MNPIVLSNEDKNICPISDNGVDYCGEPTVKPIILRDVVPGEDAIIWVCAAHYEDEGLREWWKAAGLRAEF